MKSIIHLLSRGLFAAIALSFGANSLVAQDTPPAAAPAEPAVPAEPLEPIAEPPAPEPAPPADGPIATVNGTEISQEQVLERFRAVVSRQMGQRAAGIPPEKFGEIFAGLPPEQKDELVDELIDEQLLVQAAAAEKIEVSDEKLNEQLKTIPVPPTMDLAAFLEAQGVTEEKVRADFRRGMSITMLIAKKTEGKVAEATPEEIKKFYTDNPQFFEMTAKVKARHILIKTDDPATADAAKEKIAEIRKRVVGEKAEDFATVAKEASEGPSGPKGGDLGEFGPGQMVPEFDAAVFAMKKDEISEPIKTQFGYHIIKVDETQAAGKQPLDDELKTKIAGAVKGQNEQKVVDDYIKTLREGAKIERG